ncbi:MAG: hypothetical protein ACRBC3_04940 [Burkholderiaceae bacterium]
MTLENKLSFLPGKGPVQTVMGHQIPEPRPTWRGIVLMVVAVSVPVLLIGSLLDAIVQWIFGICTGLWCFT